MKNQSLTIVRITFVNTMLINLFTTLTKSYKELIKNIEKHKLYHAQDVKKMEKQYNDLYNEGGEGYIPHFYTFEEYEYAKKQLAKLINKETKNE